jgi:hypothetical protein
MFFSRTIAKILTCSNSWSKKGWKTLSIFVLIKWSTKYVIKCLFLRHHYSFFSKSCEQRKLLIVKSDLCFWVLDKVVTIFLRGVNRFKGLLPLPIYTCLFTCSTFSAYKQNLMLYHIFEIHFLILATSDQFPVRITTLWSHFQFS